MKKGIAKEVTLQMPDLAKADYATVRGDRSKLGTFTCVDLEWGTGYNLYTQYTWNNPNDMVDWNGVEMSLNRMFSDMALKEIKIVVMPKICSGLARGHLSEAEAWGRVVTLLEKGCPSGTRVVVVEFDTNASTPWATIVSAEIPEEESPLSS